MSITKQTNSQLTSWIEELDKANQWLEDSTPENIFDFLNKRENLCTPGYILRRQIQVNFPELITEAATKSGVDSFADLQTSGNIAWKSELVDSLAEVLSTTAFANYGTESLKISKENWQRYLNDEAKCNRSTAIKLIFAFKMDDANSTKFLLSAGHELLNLRNPFDYACQACLSCHLNYLDAVALFQRFDKEFEKDLESEEYTVDVSREFTEPIKNETMVDLKSVKMSKEELVEILF